MRTRGYRAHRTPGIPCALGIERAERTGQTSRARRGEIAKVCVAVIARSEATKQSIVQQERKLDCFASLAMTERSPSAIPPLPPRALARGGVRGEQSSLSRSGVGGLSVCSSGSESAEAPPTPDPSPPLRGGRGAHRRCQCIDGPIQQNASRSRNDEFKSLTSPRSSPSRSAAAAQTNRWRAETAAGGP